MLNIVLLCCMVASETPKVMPADVRCCMIVKHPPHKPVRECWITPNKLVILHAAAVVADGVTTRQMAARGFHEMDPVVRPLIGAQPTYARMVPLGAAEVLGSYFLARKYPRLRWLQLSFTVTHGICAAHNSRL